MKRTILALTGIATLGFAAYLGTGMYAKAQQPGGVQQVNSTVPAKPLQTRIAVLNLQAVIKNYKKWQQFQDNVKATYQQYENQLKPYRDDALKLKARLDQLPAGDSAREDIERQIRDLNRKAQDQSELMKKELNKTLDQQSVQVYAEVEDVVTRFARQYEFDMVLHFNDAVAPADLHHPVNIQRKMQLGALMPLYTAPGMDITDYITKVLNSRVETTTTAPAAGQQ